MRMSRTNELRQLSVIFLLVMRFGMVANVNHYSFLKKIRPKVIKLFSFSAKLSMKFQW